MSSCSVEAPRKNQSRRFVRRSGRCCKSVSCAAQTPAQKGLVYPGEIPKVTIQLYPEKAKNVVDNRVGALVDNFNFILCGEKSVLAKVTPQAVRLQFKVSTAPLRSSSTEALLVTITTTTTKRTPWIRIRTPSFLYMRRPGMASVWYLF